MRRKRTKKMLAVLLAVCFLFTAFPTTVSAATVRKPVQVKIVSAKATKANTYNNSKVTIKWKKVKKNTTNYQIYQRTGSGKWKLAKTVKKNKLSTKITVKGGKKYQFKVRAINKKNSKVKYGKFSKVKSVSIKKSTAIPDSGSFELDFINIETNKSKKTLSCKFEYNNLDKYDKNPKNYFIVNAIQDGKSLKLKSGSISKNVSGLTKVKLPLTFIIESEKPILLQCIDKEDKTLWVEYVVDVD